MELKMDAKPHNLHGARHTYMWGTTRPLDHANLNMLQVSVSELWAMLSYHGIEDGCQTTQPAWHPTHLHVGDYQTTSPCEFECTVGEQLNAPRWLPNHATYIVPVTLALGDHQTTLPCKFEHATGIHQ